ncbi:MAG: sulfite exporter TauE/SafE family protein [Chloroflexota bacterium]
MFWAFLALIGLFIGAFGTLIGAAGGFLLVPILLFLYPQDSPATITSITLTVAFCNALSGSIAYGHLRRIDYRSGLTFAAASVPGAIIGANITAALSRGIFEIVFAAVLLLVAGYLMFRPERRGARAAGAFLVERRVTDREGNTFTYAYNRVLGIGIAFFVGLLSGLLGIGGGIIHVPALTQLLNFPVYIATATSHFVVALTTFSAVITHVAQGIFTEGVGRAAVLSAGAIVGAQFGARFSHRVPGVLIVRLLAAGLAIVALRLLIAGL